MHPHSPSPGLVSPIHKKEMDPTSMSMSTSTSVRANLKLLVNNSQQAAKAKEEVN
jgi:hypothetical protein